MSRQAEKSMEDVIKRDGRYPPAAFGFLHEGLTAAAKDVHGEQAAVSPNRHVTGQQICAALRNLAVERYGQLAKSVLARWNILSTIDFGNMVYLLIEHGFMKKTQEDSIDDFRDVFDFDQAFQTHDEFDLKE